MAQKCLCEFSQSHLSELLRGLFPKIFDEVIDDPFLETKLNSDVFAENDLTFEHVLVNKNQFDARHQVFKLLVGRQRPKGINGFWVAD